MAGHSQHSLSLARSERAWLPVVMAATPDDETTDRRRVGAALKTLRIRAGLTQEEAGDRMGVTGQAWQNYEKGDRNFTPKLLRQVTTALGVTEEDLWLEAARPEAGPGAGVFREVEDRFARRYELPVAGVVRAGGLAAASFQPPAEPEVLDLAPFFGSDSRILKIQGESMIPWVQPGGWVSYDRRDWPRRGDGCVIEFRDGRDPLVKRFEKTLGGTLYVTELFPEERELTFPLDQVAGVYKVGLRSD